MEQGVSLPHLLSEGNSPVVLCSGPSLVLAVLEVIELAFKRFGWREAAITLWRTNLHNNFAESSLSS